MSAIASILETPSAAKLQVEVRDSFAGLDHLRDAWDRLAQSNGSPVYMTYDWVRVWWKHYQGKRALRLFLFRAEDELVGAVPLYIDEIGAGPWRLRVARLVGANVPPRLLHPPVAEEHLESILQSVVSRLFSDDDCDSLVLGPFSESWTHHQKLKALLPELNVLGAVETQVTGVHAVFHLPGSYDEYLEGLSKNERKNRRKYELRLLAKEFETRLEVFDKQSALAEEFERFMQQHALQWHEEGTPGHFHSWPNAVPFNRELVETQGRLERLKFIRILANNEVISNQYSFAFGDTLFWELPSRIVGPEWERFSLGRSGVTTMIQKAIEMGLSKVEGGIGHYDYKLRLNATEYPVYNVRIVRDSARSRRALAAAQKLRAAASILYQKIWYRRVLRKLPLRWQRPHANFWLRLDF